jgi:putative ABC transport system permease protein
MLVLVRRALRSLRRAPGVSSTVMLTLALGIGLASATGVVARAIAFAGLPVRDAGRIVVLWGVDKAGSFQHLPLAPRELPALATAMRGIATIAAGDYNGAYPWQFAPPDGSGAPLRLRGTLAGGSYFDVLGARPILGRALRPEDDVVGAARVMVLSHATWRRQFGGDPAVVGRSLQSVIWGQPYTIVGVMPPGLDVPRGVEFWTAFAPTAAGITGTIDDTPWAVDVVARLAPGATAEQARQVLTTYYATLAARGATHYAGARATVRTLSDLVSGDVRPAFTVLGAAAALVLLVTCGNVAGLLLVRAGARRRELAVRAAIGASRVRLLIELLVEHAVLALAGGAAGAAIAAGFVRAFAALAPAELPRVADVGLDWTLLAAVTAVTTIVVLAVGLIPAAAATRVSPAEALGGGRDDAGSRPAEVRARRLLVGAQVALAVVVLTGASLVGRSLARLTMLDLGLAAPETVAFLELIAAAEPGARPSTTRAERTAELTRWWSRQEAILERVRTMPGIVAAAPVVQVPFAGAGGWDARIEAEGAAPQDSARRPYVNMEITDAEYLRATGARLVRGRWLAPSDRERAPRVVVLSEQAARILFPSGDALGRRVKLWGETFATIVGIVGDTRFRELLTPRPSMYLPYRQFDGGATFLAVRTRADPADAGNAIRRVVADVAPNVLVQPHGTLRDRLAEPLARPRFVTGILGAYAAVVVTLAVAGLYAVIAGSVAARRRELGVRAALGATPGALVSLVLGEGLRVAAGGIVAGLLVTLAATRLVAALLYGMSATDPLTIGAAAAALLAVCATAIMIPARRASRADPASALRAT